MHKRNKTKGRVVVTRIASVLLILVFILSPFSCAFSENAYAASASIFSRPFISDDAVDSLYYTPEYTPGSSETYTGEPVVEPAEYLDSIWRTTSYRNIYYMLERKYDGYNFFDVYVPYRMIMNDTLFTTGTFTYETNYSLGDPDRATFSNYNMPIGAYTRYAYSAGFSVISDLDGYIYSHMNGKVSVALEEYYTYLKAMICAYNELENLYDSSSFEGLSVDERRRKVDKIAKNFMKACRISDDVDHYGYTDQEWTGSMTALRQYGAQLIETVSSAYQNAINTLDGSYFFAYGRKDGSVNDPYDPSAWDISNDAHYHFCVYDDRTWNTIGRDMTGIRFSSDAADFMTYFNASKDANEFNQMINDIESIMYNMYMLDATDGSYVAEEENPGSIEAELAGFVASIATKLSNLTLEQNMAMESVIFGRVRIGSTSSNPIHVNNFGFELVKNNPYGIIGAFAYSIVRAALVLAMFIMAMWYVMKMGIASSAKQISDAKSKLSYGVLSFLLLFLMPGLLECVIWFRDVLLKQIGEFFMSSGTPLAQLRDVFFVNSLNQNFVTALEYLGVIVLGVYFAFIYISAALGLTIMFVFFPLVLLVGYTDNQVLGQWVKYVIGILINPLIDCVLMGIVYIASQLGMGDLGQLLMCMCIIPSRSAIKAVLKMNSSAAAEMVGMGALITAGRAAGAVVGAARQAVGGVASGVSGAAKEHSKAKGYQTAGKESGKLKETATKKENMNLDLLKGGMSETSSEGGASDSDFFQNLHDSDSGSFTGIGEENGFIDAGYFGGGGDGGGFSHSFMSGERLSRQSSFDSALSTMNMDDPVLKGGASYDAMAKMHNRKAVLNLATGVGRGVTSGVSATMYGAAGLGAGLFLGPTGAMAGMGLGTSIGSTIGDAKGAVVGGAAGEVVVGGAEIVHRSNDSRAQREEALQKNSQNLSYQMMRGNSKANYSALNSEQYVAAQKKQLSDVLAGGNKDDIVSLINNQQDILARNGGYASGGSVSMEGLYADTEFGRNLSEFKSQVMGPDSSYGISESDIRDISAYNYTGDGYVNYNSHNSSNVDMWAKDMMSGGDRTERALALNDPDNVAKFEQICKSACANHYDEEGNETKDYLYAKGLTQKVINVNSGANRSNPQYISNSFAAGRTWNKYFGDKQSGGRFGNGGGNGGSGLYDTSGNQTPNPEMNAAANANFEELSSLLDGAGI